MYLAALLNYNGISPDAAAHWDLGTIIDYCAEMCRLRKISRGEEVTDPDEQYEQLKALLPEIKKQYEAGNVTEEKYKRLIQTIEEYERG